MEGYAREAKRGMAEKGTVRRCRKGRGDEDQRMARRINERTSGLNNHELLRTR